MESRTYSDYLALDEILDAQRPRSDEHDEMLFIVVHHVDVIETMTPRQFTGFRAQLGAASGFQSAQFRQIEIALGRRDRRMLDAYPARSARRSDLERALERPSVWHSQRQLAPGDVATELTVSDKPAVVRAYLRRWKFQVGPDSTDEELAAAGGRHPVFALSPVAGT